MIEAADEVIVVSDSSKFGHSALAHLCPLDVVDRMVVDSGIADEWRRTLRDSGVDLTIVDAA
jgi:DeoR family transcriptional regulator of aga operon